MIEVSILISNSIDITGRGLLCYHIPLYANLGRCVVINLLGPQPLHIKQNPYDKYSKVDKSEFPKPQSFSYACFNSSLCITKYMYPLLSSIRVSYQMPGQCNNGN